MATKYYAVLTNIGAAKLANATALGSQVEITQMAVGDGNGALPTPNPAQTALVHELRRAPLNTLSIDPNNANQIIAEQVIPEDVGGWWIREIGLFDKDGDMIAIANCAETYKPQLQEGSGRVQIVRMILIVSNTAAVTLKIDPSVVLATRQYVDDQIIQVKAYVDQQLAAHVAAADPHTQYLLESDFDKFFPVGFPLPWPQATPPSGWLKCNGATFDKAKYPKLATAYPSGVLPDLRSEFLRGWDDGRGVDSARNLLSQQGYATEDHAHGLPSRSSTVTDSTVNFYFDETWTTSGTDIIKWGNTNDAGLPAPNYGTFKTFKQSVSSLGTSAAETRPRNVAFNYIVRAA
ncbi:MULTISPECIES: phage tail-collar fiber domain-containing protein [Enterobacteriaceae]|uniref:phage tail-collar fiber domain-containing protein n=1 Tax=Enterobacteriaceae TaxID=543 RepID=UPI0007507D43|nr:MULTISPECIES: phage tail protein [Enterobacteriaceae]QLW23618.1 phage tail protein [Enterobacter cloacae]HAN2662263.1 phage tail protein [Escherichia coli O25b:H4-ST131]ELV1587263.1 phage tail protein [Escherichia coli]KUT56398.1 phage tail protein [Escherichia coli]MCY9474456.1 phage tail protein [Escherichia coli]